MSILIVIFELLSLLLWWLVRHFGISPVDVKDFMNGLPVGFWTVLGSLITAAVAMLTLVVTQVVNLHTQDRQANNQNKALSKQLDHQKEMAYIQYFLDKRTSAILDFQKKLEETKADLTYFFSEPADLERRTAFGLEYKNDEEPRWKGNMVIDDIHWIQINELQKVSLEQIKPVQERINELNASLNILTIYLSEDEIEVANKLIERIDYLQHFIIGNLKGIKSSDDKNIFMFVHAGEPMTNILEEINTFHKSVRQFLKKYLYIDKLEV